MAWWQMPFEATMPAFHAIISSWKLCISAMEHIPKFYWKYRIISRSIKAKPANIGVLKVGQQFVGNITKIRSNLNTDICKFPNNILRWKKC